jgi:hypothetical protein
MVPGGSAYGGVSTGALRVPGRDAPDGQSRHVVPEALALTHRTLRGSMALQSLAPASRLSIVSTTHSPGPRLARRCTLAVLASVAVAASAPATGAQVTRQASARITVPVILRVRAASAAAVRELRAGVREVELHVTTSANVAYTLQVVPAAAMTGRQARIAICTVGGVFRPLVPGEALPAARGERGATSATTVIVRIEERGRSVADLEAAIAMLAFQATAERPDGARVAGRPFVLHATEHVEPIEARDSRAGVSEIASR